jgi:hypothetical protein
VCRRARSFKEWNESGPTELSNVALVGLRYEYGKRLVCKVCWSKVKHDHLQSRLFSIGIAREGGKTEETKNDDEGRSDEDVCYWNNTAHELPLVQSTTLVALIFLGGLRSIGRVYFFIPTNP